MASTPTSNAAIQSLVNSYTQPESGKDLEGLKYKPLTFGPKNDIGRLGKSGRKAVSDLAGVTLGINRYLPSIFNTIAQAQTQQAPAITESQLKLLQQYGPQFTEAESAMSSLGAKRAAESQLDIQKTITPELMARNQELARQADPEFYKTRANVSGAAEDLINSINPNGLTEGEMTLAERSQNRTNIGQGTQNTGSPSAGIKSALGFDNRLSAKRDQLNSVLGNIGSFMPNMKSGIFEGSSAQAGGAGGQQSGFENFQSASSGSQNTASGIASNMMGQGGMLAANARNIQANKTPAWQQMIGATNSILDTGSNVASSSY